MDFEANRDERMHKVAAILLENRTGTEDWGEISHLADKPCTKRIANKFLVCCLLDYQIDADLAWRNGCRLVKEILHDPEDVWSAINSVSQDEWGSKFKEYHLHRFPNAHNRLWRIGREIRNRYDGDARQIWKNKGSGEVLERLLALNAGEQISRMIVGALLDCRQIEGSGDVKADLHVCRALGRIVYGAPTNPAAAVELARQLNPSDPWELDQPLWKVGKSCCRPDTPSCPRCYLSPHCTYADEHHLAN